ncbi:MAG: hypothetical protein U0168_08210 [Nannocystaceae bacterium]
MSPNTTSYEIFCRGGGTIRARTLSSQPALSEPLRSTRFHDTSSALVTP